MKNISVETADPKKPLPKTSSYHVTWKSSGSFKQKSILKETLIEDSKQISATEKHRLNNWICYNRVEIIELELKRHFFLNIVLRRQANSRDHKSNRYVIIESSKSAFDWKVWFYRYKQIPVIVVNRDTNQQPICYNQKQ